jgi:hypothetical protein
MIANGARRGAEFTTEAMLKSWLDFLSKDVLPA